MTSDRTSRCRPKVLVVDDDETIRDSLQLVFEDRYDVVTCSSPAEGIALMDRDVHLVILDIRLNGRDGFWTYRAIRERFKDTPMLFYSAYQDAMDPYDVMNDYRPFAFLLKDGDLTRLERVVEEAVGLYAEKQERDRYLASVERLTSVGTLAASMAHEINNPLTYILGNLEHVKALLDPKGPRSREVFEAVDTSINGVLRIADIVKRLKDYSLPGANVHQQAHVLSTVEQAAETVENELRNRASLRIECSGRIHAACDPGALNQVLVDMLLNTARALPVGRTKQNEVVVHSWLDEATDEVVLRISDSGPGIDDAVRDRIFEPFVTTRADSGGMGIGLFVVHNIITSAGGVIRLIDDPDVHGAAFEIRLPAALRPKGEGSPVARPDVGAPEPLSILVIDDDPLVGDAVVKLLSTHEAEWVENAEVGLDRIASGAPDIVFCDMMMADLSGRDVYTRLEALGRGDEGRIVFLTGGVLDPDLQRFLDRVENLVLMKPVSAQDLGSVIEQMQMRMARADSGA